MNEKPILPGNICLVLVRFDFLWPLELFCFLDFGAMVLT